MNCVNFLFSLFISEEDCDANNSGNCETVEFKVIFNKQKFDVNFPMDNTVRKLKEHVQTLTGSHGTISVSYREHRCSKAKVYYSIIFLSISLIIYSWCSKEPSH